MINARSTLNTFFIIDFSSIIFAHRNCFNLASAFTPITAYSFLVFNLLCAPCFAAIGAIRREMNNTGWTWFAICYQCGFAYVIALMINQFGNLFTGNANFLGVVVAVIFLVGMVYMLFKPYKEATKLNTKL